MLDFAYTGVKYHPSSSSGGLDGIVFGKDEKEGRRGVVGGSFAVVTRATNGSSCCVYFAASWKGWRSDAG
ncbi:expressed unknown protein [Ectocarpus siliculosus]|uniref:Uncharacterized protein n=1 Tax=Ectocarpus siliculosus TaxID=2880 RepID=D7FYQ7_ECTSI|nr:expressed unknown protein [Ectocarpus siliculosus]|eukprot:CBJ32607.1 expressed unknown protein [Ectocarpus siliculosus]